MNFEVVIFHFKLSLTFLDKIAADMKGEIIFFFTPTVFIKEFVKLKKKSLLWPSYVKNFRSGM